MSIGVTWASDEESAKVQRLLDWASRVWDAMRPYTSTESYQNFIDPALRDWQHGYYGANLERLTTVKRHIDPDDVFQFAQSIPLHV